MSVKTQLYLCNIQGVSVCKTSQPNTSFGLFQLGHLQVGHKGQRNYTIMHIISLKSGGDKISFTKFGACAHTGGIEIYGLLSVVCGNIFIHCW